MKPKHKVAAIVLSWAIGIFVSMFGAFAPLNGFSAAASYTMVGIGTLMELPCCCLLGWGAWQAWKEME